MSVKAAFPPRAPLFTARLLPAALGATALSASVVLAALIWMRDAGPSSLPQPDTPVALEASPAEPAPDAPAIAPRLRATGHFLGLIPDAPDALRRSATAEPIEGEDSAADPSAAAPLPPRRPQFAHEASGAARPAPGPPQSVAPSPDPRGLFERLFNIRPSQGQALAYARPDSGVGAGGGLADKPMPMGYEDGKTAVYDISARVVIMPNGEKLEAHSGLGPLMDDPNNVHVKNKGATPPNVYNLTLRESLFHGVQALRMTPVGGSTMFGRDGILAHSYLLGPNGDSNGCVSFKNYDRFLQAFHAGDVRRLIVVTRRG